MSAIPITRVLQKLDEYLERLTSLKGNFTIKPLNTLIDKLAQEMAKIADLTDDNNLWDSSKRALVSAWKAGCLLWALNNQTWTVSIGNLVEWLVYHDLWSKMQIFADLLKGGDTSISEAGKSGPKNMLDNLTDSFSATQLEALRISIGKSGEDTKRQLRVWLSRKFITTPRRMSI